VGFQNWFRRISRFSESRSMSSAGDGWTNDLSLNLQAGRKREELVGHVFAANEQGRQHEVLIVEFREQFGLSADDAEIAVDRVCGGIVRAPTGNRANCPDRTKDPIAWMSFQRAIAKR
jgi:hypothetical protein